VERNKQDSSDDCRHIVVILGTSHIYIWNRDQVESVLESKVPEIRGTWNLVTVPTEAGVPNHDECPEGELLVVNITLYVNFVERNKQDIFMSCALVV
jgi:hypothetical protein